LIFFTKNLHLVQIFGEKDDFFRPARGGISCQVNDRVTPVNNRNYAARVQTGRLTR
jgi:hypothetical protein